MASEDLSIQIDTAAIEKQLSALPEKTQRSYLRNALQAGGDIILREMVALAPERTDDPTPEDDSLPPGVLRADLHTQLVGASEMRVGPSEATAHVARWVERGWTLTGHGKSKASRKRIKQIPGKHFMSGAVDAGAVRAVDAFVQSLVDQLEESGHE